MSNKILIVLDSRESQLRNELAINNIEHVVEQLTVGDVVFKETDSGNILLICERKTSSDMYSSIISGRYAEQRERLKSTNVKICYILENYTDKSTFCKNEFPVVSGALEKLVLYHNIHILPTLSVSHTAKVISSIANKLTKDSRIGFGENEGANGLKIVSAAPVVAAVITQRKDKVMEHILEHQLLLIPGVSLNVAKVVSSLYPTVKSLVQAYDNLQTEKEKWNMLTEIPLGKRKLGPVLSKRISSVYT